MATVFKNDNSPFWKARYFDADGKRVSKSTGVTAKKEAKRIAAKYEADERDTRNKSNQLPKVFASILETVAREAASGELTLAKAEAHIAKLHKLANPDFTVISLGEYWQQWITEQRRHVSDSTAKGYDQDLAIFTHALGKKAMAAPLQSITTAQINTAMDKAKETTKKSETGKRPVTRRATTINKALTALRRVMETAVSQKLIAHNPAKLCRALGTSDSTTRAPFTITELRAMIDHKQTSDEWKGAITIAAHTGLRLSDVLSLSTKNLDGTRLVIMPSKTSESKKVITVPLTPACIKWIGKRKGDFFPKLKKQKTAVSSTQFKRIMEKASVPCEIEQAGGIKASRSFHALRHTFASLLAEADVHADIRQKLTGHSDSKIHQRYTHHDEALDRAVGTLPSL
jgi:integrase